MNQSYIKSICTSTNTQACIFNERQSLYTVKLGFRLLNVHTIVVFQMCYTQKLATLDWWTLVIANQVVAFKIIYHFSISHVYGLGMGKQLALYVGCNRPWKRPT